MSPNIEGVRPQLLIVDVGSQYTLKIESTLREIGYRSAIFGPGKAAQWLKKNDVKGIILSGGPASVNDPNAPKIPDALYDADVPILAICYGMQDVAKRFGGKVESVEEQRGYGLEKISVLPGTMLFKGLPEHQEVWASHGDSVTEAPPGFIVTARTFGENAVAGMCGGKNRSIWCVQFHPEVAHTPYGKPMLLHFASTICGCEEDWKPRDIIKVIRKQVLAEIGDRHAIIGFSGGVDSTTLARILSPALGNRLHGIVINGGQFREGEIEEVQRHAEAAGVKIKIVKAQGRFLEAFGETIHSERVRKVFKEVYAEIFREEALKIIREHGKQVVLIQGTLAPDLIESGATGGALIKSHHNVGLKIRGVEQLHPIGNLFKYEIRAIARRLRLPKSVTERQPFPGPGLFIRLPGFRKTREKLCIVRWIDARSREVLERHGWYHRVSQLVSTYEAVKLVGVKGDARVYKPYACVRAVKTIDFMTAEGIKFPKKVIEDLEMVITRHKEVSRVRIDSTNKPPGTTEAE